MVSTKTLLTTLPFLLSTVTAVDWFYIDTYEKGCTDSGQLLSGKTTVSGNSGEPAASNKCLDIEVFIPNPDPRKSGTTIEPRSVDLHGFTDKGWTADFYAALDCPEDSLVTSVTKDGCFSSSESVSIGY